MSGVEVERSPRWGHRVPMLPPGVPGWLNVLLGLGMMAMTALAAVLLLGARGKAPLPPGKLLLIPLVEVGGLGLAVWGFLQARKASRGVAALRAWATARGFTINGHTVRGQAQGQPFVAHVGLRRGSSKITGLVVVATSGEESVMATIPVPDEPAQGIAGLDGALSAVMGR